MFDDKAGHSRRSFLALVGASIAGIGCAKASEGAEAKQAASTPTARGDLYQCEGCEGAAERPAASLSWHSAISPPGEPGQPLRIEGVVYAPDGRTPAADVVIYAYQTDASGVYSRGVPGTEASRRHGLLRGWVKTQADGRYRFDTIKPAPYPGDTIPAHVHLTVLEPGRRPYWIDDVVFAGEFGVTEDYRRAREDRGGSGIVTLAEEQGRLLARRDIILERHPTQ